MQKSITGAVLRILPALLLTAIMACSGLPASTAVQAPAATQAQQPHVRKMQTAGYVGNRGAIILSIANASDQSLKAAVDAIIRTAGENRVPVDVSLAPLPDNNNYTDFIYLRDYIDAGAINISLDGNSIMWLDATATKSSPAYENLKNSLIKYREQFRQFFGSAPVNCVLSDQYFLEINYAVLRDAGFKSICSSSLPEISSYKEPVAWSGRADSNGLYCLPIVASIDYTLPPSKKSKPNPSVNAKIMSGVDKTVQSAVENSLRQSDLAAVEIVPASFFDNDGKIDPAKVSQLAALVKYLGRKGDITTVDDWYSYIARWAASTVKTNRVMPVYNGGPAIIFRLDDVASGWHEDVDKEVLLLFEKNGVPVDLGVVSNVDGTDSYDMPWLKEYVKKGVAGISVHGYNWDYYQLDSTQSGTQYADIKSKLRKARDSYTQNFGVTPVALTVPTDYFDKTGYLAVQDAGYKIFATHITEETHPSTDPVDYQGRKDPAGMYRIPTSSDVCEWDDAKATWGNITDISQIAVIPDYCKYYNAYEELSYNELCYMTCSQLSYLGIAAISIHPDAFIDANGKVDKEKLAKLQPIITWAKKQATVTTFEAWYNFTTAQKR